MDLSTFLGQCIVKVAQDGVTAQPKRFLNPALAGKFRDVQARQAQARAAIQPPSPPTSPQQQIQQKPAGGKVSLDQELVFRSKRGSDPAVSNLLSNLQSMKKFQGPKPSPQMALQNYLKQNPGK